MGLDLLFAGPLSSKEQTMILEQLRLRRFQQLKSLLSWARNANQHEVQRPGSLILAGYVAALNNLKNSPDRTLGVIDQWGITFFISRYLHHGVEEKLVFDRLNSNLLFESCADGSSPLNGIEFTTRTDSQGCIPVLHKHGLIRLRRWCGGNEELIWRCSSSNVSVFKVGQEFQKCHVRLPLQEEGCEEVEFIPYNQAEQWGLSVIGNGKEALLLKDFQATGHSSAESVMNDGPPPLTLCESLNQAHKILLRIWPEVITWAKLLVPAFVDIGTPYNPFTRKSGSFGPGIPVYLSRVSESYLHAEDIVHEVQHQRFDLLVPSQEYFGRWSDDRPLFASPYRSDARPITGLHRGLHAFLAVNEFRLRYQAIHRLSPDQFFEMLKTHRQNLFVLRTILSSDRLSEGGRQYYAKIEEELARHEAFIAPRVTFGVSQAMDACLSEHLSKVIARHPHIENRNVSSSLHLLGEQFATSGTDAVSKRKYDHENTGKTL